MKPSKQESVSRQSSILKAPKHRQPLQCVAANPSSSENSPTVKIKRRVSFAKNRRIRQFCNEAEQETVWDNTYEEHDSSHTKSSSGGSPDKPIIISVPSYDKENFPVQLFLKDNQLDCKEVQTNVPVEEGDNLSQCDMEMDNSLINPEIGKALPQNNENEFPNATIYCDDGMDMTSYVPASIIPCRTVSAPLDDTELVSQTCTQNTSMELTENIPSIMRKNFNQEQKHVLSTDLTQALSKLLGNGRLTNQTNNTLFEDGSENTNTVPIGFTSILPSSTWIKPNTPCSNNENTENFNSKTMELTAAVPYTNIQSNANYQKLFNKSKQSEGTEIFSNKSMEITQAVPVLNKDRLENSNLKLGNHNLIQENTEIFGNKSREMTEAISNHNQKPYLEEKTRILNASMEITEIPHLNKIHQIHIENLNNETMEFTAAVPYNDIQSNANNRKLNNKTRLSERTEIFLNKSMEITEAVPVLNKELLNQQKLKEDSQNLISEKTEIFGNKSMEMTEAISNYNTKPYSEEKTRILDASMEMTEIPHIHKIHQMCRENFNNETMEFTAAVPYTDIQSNTNNQKLNNKTKASERTEIFSNKSMEITEAVPAFHKDILYNSKLALDKQNLVQEKTEIFGNKSMEMTEAISNSKDKLYPGERTRILNASMEMTEIPIHKNNQHLMQEKTEIFGNKSMEMTEAISNSKDKLYPGERTRILNASMEMTEIPHLNKIHYLHRENLSNETMEFTAAVPYTDIQSDKTGPSERTGIFSNKSMEITEAVPALNKDRLENSNLKLDNLNVFQEKTEVFGNKSMEMTEAISNSKDKLYPGERTRILNASMEMTEIPHLNKIHHLHRENLSNERMEFTAAVPYTDIQSDKTGPSERTEIFSNKSMEIIGAVPALNKDRLENSNLKLDNLNVFQEKTEVFGNKSMEMTEAICNYNKKLYREEKTRILNASMEMTEIPHLNKIHQVQREDFNNETMEFTAAVPHTQSNANYQKLINKTRPSEKTEIFSNKSMEITEAVPVLNKDLLNDSNLKLGNHNLIQEKTELFGNKSMEMTEAICNYNKKLYPEERTRIFNASMEMTGIPIHNKNNQVNINFHDAAQEKTNIFFNKSMDITETIPINQEDHKRKLVNQNSQTKIFVNNSMDLTAAIIASIDNLISNEKVNEITLSTSRNSESSTSHHTDINARQSLHVNIKATSKSVENISALSNNCNLQSKILEQENYLTNSNAGRIDQDISADMTSRLPILQTTAKEFLPQSKSDNDKYRQSCFGESNKEYQDFSIDRTEPDILSCSKSNSKQLQSSNVQRNVSRTNKEENKFHRLTTDELQLLCASLNLPTQKTEKEQSVISQKTQNFITDCNDVNVLRDSLKNKSNFQKSNILSEGDKSFNILSEVNSDFRRSYDLSTGNKNLEPSRLDVVRNVPSMMDISTFGKSIENKSGVLQSELDSSKTGVLTKTMTIPGLMEIDRTAEISLKRPELLEMSCSSTKVLPASNYMNKNNEFAKDPLILNQKVPETVEMSMTESIVNTAPPTVEMSGRHSKVQIYNDISMEFSSMLPASSTVKRKSSEKNQSPVSKKNFTSHANRSVYTSESLNSGKEYSDVVSKENSLCRMPSDSTDVLVATMGFKTDLPHPLVINEKTMITVSTKSFSNKTYSIGVSSSIQNEIQADKTYVVNKMENQIELNYPKLDKNQQENENIKQSYEIPTVESNVEENEEQESNSDKENKEPRVRANLFPEQYSEELEEIQPPSFLASDSIQDESLDNREIQKDDSSDSILNNSNKQQSNSLLHKEKNSVIADNDIQENHSSNEIKVLSNVILNPPEEIKPKNKKHSKKNKVKKIEVVEEIPSEEVKEEIVVPLTPFELLAENIKAHEKRDDCIWSIRSLNENMIAADFISKSLVFVIRLNAVDVACNKDIQNVQVISRLRSGTKDVLLKIVHNLLLAKLKPEELLEKYKMYEDVLRMLDYVSSEVIFAMNFKFDIERLNATNVFNIDEERILFMVASKKTNIILKVSVSIKIFNEIRADDVHVACILGDIRKNDIKQLIVNIKKDSKFLSRYINDVRDYITLMEESTCLNKH